MARTRTETPPGIDRAWRCTLNNSPRSLRTRRTALLRLTATRSRGIFESYRDTRSRKSTRVMELCGTLGHRGLIICHESSPRKVRSDTIETNKVIPVGCAVFQHSHSIEEETWFSLSLSLSLSLFQKIILILSFIAYD